jgi:hypothetical protein
MFISDDDRMWLATEMRTFDDHGLEMDAPVIMPAGSMAMVWWNDEVCSTCFYR